MVLHEAKLLESPVYGTLRRSLFHENLKFRDIQELGKVGLSSKTRIFPNQVALSSQKPWKIVKWMGNPAPFLSKVQ